ncbi:MAG: cytochrome c [Caulobacteraceae bacterium]
MAAEADAGGAKAAPAPSGAVADIDRGRKIFDGSACGGCHTLAAAGATGEVGPSLDGDPKLTTAFVIDRVTNGQGGMPAFSGQLSDEDIAALAAYVVKASAK